MLTGDVPFKGLLAAVRPWSEGPGWTRDRSDEREIIRVPFEYEIRVQGPKFPRMKQLTLEVLPL